MVIKVFLDTNILVDFLCPERSGHEEAGKILSMILDGDIEAQISTQSIIDAAYIVQTKYGVSIEEFKEKIGYLRLRTNIGYVDSFNVKAAIADPDPDFEDSALIANAEYGFCDIFLTGDKKLLSRPKRPVMLIMTPQDFLSRCLVND